MLDPMQYQRYSQLKQEAQHIEGEIKQLRTAAHSQTHQKHLEVAHLYHQLYQIRPDSYSASRYIYHIRKSGVNEAREASRFARMVADQNQGFLNDNYFVREYVWSIYDGYLKTSGNDDDNLEEDNEIEEAKAIESPENFKRKVDAARRIFELTAEPFPCILTAFAICKEARLRKRWDLMREFGQKLQSETISTERKEINGRLLPSDYQKWLYIVTRAALELQKYDECMVYARQGIEKYPDESLHFCRWEALAKIRAGDVQGGLDQLKYADIRFPKQWYIQGDIAHTYTQLEQYQEAWLWFCRAASAPGDIKGRITILRSMCDVLQRLEEWQTTYQHLILVWAVEVALGSKELYIGRTKQKILTFRKTHADFLAQSAEEISDQAPPLSAALKPCRASWQQTLKRANPTRRGKIVQLKDEQQYGFIEDEDGARYHFKLRAFSYGRPKKDMMVEFTLEEAFDKKKGQVSTTAINIRPATLSS